MTFHIVRLWNSNTAVMFMSPQYGIILLLMVLLRCGYGDVCRDEISTKGRHFMVTVPAFESLTDFVCSINIASSGSGNAVVWQHNGNNSTKLGNYSLLQGEVKTLYIKGHSIDQVDVGKQTKVTEIASTVDVSVYVAGYIPSYSSASFVVFPVEALSVDYSIPTYKTFYGAQYNYLLITGFQNNTRINVSRYNATSLEINDTISKLESYTLKTLGDPQLATVSSSKPVNVVVGSMCTNVPRHGGNCDTMYDSPIPVKYWGNTFIVPPLKPKTGYSIRLYPRTENTTVNIEYYNNITRRNITFKGTKELLMGTDPTVVLSDHPINVVQYGFTESGENGDAFMTSVPAVTHFSNDYVFTTPFPDKGFTYRLAITIDQRHLGGLLLDGKNVPGLSFLDEWTARLSSGNYTVFILEIKPGDHTLRHQSLDVKFGAILYGLKSYYGFGHSLGFSFPLDNKNICQNGGSCMRDGRCICLPGFTGDSCERNIDDCASIKCHNGATCVDGIGQFLCQCSPGWTGQYCESDIDECVSMPCQNGAICQDGVNQFSCRCDSGLTGQLCETALRTDDLMCFDCGYTTALSYCDSIKHCGRNQMCFLQRTDGAHGHIHYTSGCTDMQVCSHKNQTNGQTSNDMCLQCCEGSFCNSHGCGDDGFPQKESRGPICLDCSFASDPKACDKVTICGVDEMCHIEELPWGANSIFHLGCKSKRECALWTGKVDHHTDASIGGQGALKQRSVPRCKSCCLDDYCNQNCTSTDNNHQQIIVG